MVSLNVIGRQFPMILIFFLPLYVAESATSNKMDSKQNN